MIEKTLHFVLCCVSEKSAKWREIIYTRQFLCVYNLFHIILVFLSIAFLSSLSLSPLTLSFSLTLFFYFSFFVCFFSFFFHHFYTASSIQVRHINYGRDIFRLHRNNPGCIAHIRGMQKRVDTKSFQKTARKERRMIRSGSVFVFDESESGKIYNFCLFISYMIILL